MSTANTCRRVLSKARQRLLLLSRRTTGWCFARSDHHHHRGRCWIRSSLSQRDTMHWWSWAEGSPTSGLATLYGRLGCISAGHGWGWGVPTSLDDLSYVWLYCVNFPYEWPKTLDDTPCPLRKGRARGYWPTAIARRDCSGQTLRPGTFNIQLLVVLIKEASASDMNRSRFLVRVTNGIVPRYGAFGRWLRQQQVSYLVTKQTMVYQCNLKVSDACCRSIRAHASHVRCLLLYTSAVCGSRLLKRSQ